MLHNRYLLPPRTLLYHCLSSMTTYVYQCYVSPHQNIRHGLISCDVCSDQFLYPHNPRRPAILITFGLQNSALLRHLTVELNHLFIWQLHGTNILTENYHEKFRPITFSWFWILSSGKKRRFNMISSRKEKSVWPLPPNNGHFPRFFKFQLPLSEPWIETVPVDYNLFSVRLQVFKILVDKICK